MAHQNPEETTETSSDFMTFQLESSSTEVSEESNKVDVHKFLADQNKMKDFISCRNCKQEFDHVSHKPFLLPCLDAICKNCILEISESASYECDKCHICFQNGHLSLQIDNTREIASEIFRIKNGGSSLMCEMCTNDNVASHRCFDCSVFICEDCVRLHLSLKTLKSHFFKEIKCLLTGKIKNLGLSYVSRYCPVAGHEKEQIKMHCSDPLCVKNVCVLCAISAHKNHNLCDITKVGKGMETKMETFLKSIELKVEKANTSIAQLSVINGKCLKNSQQLQAEIKARFFEAKKTLEKREKDLCEAVALHLKEKQLCIENEKKKILSFSSSCKESIFYGKVSSEVNDHNHFVDIANIILPHLEVLDRQVPEIELTLDTMTFSSQSSDSCFETIINSLGKLLVSNAYSPKSKVVVTPAVCSVGRQIQFKIQLFSSTGNLIIDEDVRVCLKLNGESFEFINCAFETSFSSFAGHWVPDKPLKISWVVVSNGIELRTLNGVIDIRKRRIFEKIEVTHESLQSTEEANQDLNPIESSVIMNKDMRCPMLELKTKEGLKIMIYSGSITRLNVECVVNAANDQLMHGGGVAAVISDAAGYQFDQESRDYVQKNGPIPVGRCCVTSAGKLHYKCVIHTVGPKWGDYRDKSQCLKLLQDSVKATFEEADYQKMRSIAIPAISSRIFSIPRDKCVEQYFEATVSFSRSYPFKYLQEIHFVDRDESMVRAIQETFQSRSKSASTSEKTDKKNDMLTFNEEKKTVHSKMPLSISFTTVNVSENLQIKIHIGNITDMAADALVCPQDKDCLSENNIAKDIFGKISDKQPSFNSMKYGDVCFQKLQENSKWKMIMHAVPPVYDAEYAKNHSKFVKTLSTIIQKIIKTADEAKLHSIAIPLLGTGREEYKTPVETCASSFYKAVMANKSEHMYLNDIYLVLKEEEQEKMYLEDFALINCKITQRPVTNKGKSDDFGKTMKEMPKEGENCCMCMDSPTKPKKLQKCGHIFCKECIEQYFEYKPACPSCGTIYGKVTGDQPPGTMSIRTNGIRLQGFNDSSGTIVLTYFFNDGKQGDEHPDPGKDYKGINRSGYLPFNKKGRLIAKLLNVAFSRRLVFTIGRSRTTGHDGVITWNDIHHKTRMEGGPARFGYPDPTYLDRVLEELEAKGVTEKSADDPEEYKEYSRQIGY